MCDGKSKIESFEMFKMLHFSSLLALLPNGGQWNETLTDLSAKAYSRLQLAFSTKDPQGIQHHVSEHLLLSVYSQSLVWKMLI